MNRTSCLNKFALSEKSQGDHPELSIRVLPFKDGFSPKAVGWENKIAVTKSGNFGKLTKAF